MYNDEDAPLAIQNLVEVSAHPNLAVHISEDVLSEIGRELKADIEADIESCSEYFESTKEWVELATQVVQEKSHPWPGASNVKYPMLTMAAVQFNARALPSLINTDMPVLARVVGRDDDGVKAKRALRVSKFLSYEVLFGMPEWMDDEDRLTISLPIVGTCFKKSYVDPITGKLKSRLCMPNEVVINYWATDMDTARVTHMTPMSHNALLSHQRSGVFLDSTELDKPTGNNQDLLERRGVEDTTSKRSPPGDTSRGEPMHNIGESHCFIDLDGDGYKEPYIVTLELDTGKILRIVARWHPDNFSTNESGQVVFIIPENYFTQYIFIPNPESRIYGLGFGHLIGPLNDAANTSINQLIDAGHLANMQGGFLSRGVRMRGGAIKLAPGEWEVLNNTVDDLRKGIFPFNYKEPSTVLFNLLGMLVESGEKVIAVSEMMLGQNPGQNQPATTTMAVLEQGLSVFTSIYRRMYRSQAREYQTIYNLIQGNLDEQFYIEIMDDPEASLKDFRREGLDLVPHADPNIASSVQRSLKAKSLLEKIQMGLPLNVQEVTRRVLEIEEHENIEALMQMPEQQPNPEFVLKAQEFAHTKQLDTFQSLLDLIRVTQEADKDSAQAAKFASDAGTSMKKVAVDRGRLVVDAMAQLQEMMKPKEAAPEKEPTGDDPEVQ